MDILGPLPKTVCGNQLIQEMTDCYTYLIKAVSATKIIYSHIVSLFLESWVYMHVTNTAHHPQMSHLAERFNKRILERLPVYLAGDGRK